MRGRAVAGWIGTALLVAGMLVNLYLILIWAPAERTMGDLQRIFYFHVPSAWVAFAAFFAVFAFGMAYLVTRDLSHDHLALASAETGVLFCTVAIVTGPIWAKPAWGVWWIWDARLSSTFILWLIYVSYLLLRGFVDDPHRRATLGAVVGIVGFADVPIVFMSIRWWRTQHPSPVLAGGEGSGLDPDMKVVLLFSAVVFTLLAAALIGLSARIRRLDAERAELERVMESEV